jgi:hypothetical protein
MIKSILTLVSGNEICKTKGLEDRNITAYMYVLNVESEYSKMNKDLKNIGDKIYVNENGI